MLTSSAPKREANANETNVETDSAKVPGSPTLADAEGTTTDEASPTSSQLQDRGPVLRTLADEVDGDEFISDAVNYKLLMEKLDKLLEKLDLEA